MSDHRGQIIICDNVEERAQTLQASLLPARVVSFVKEKFLVEDAKAVIEEAYLSEESVKYLLIGAVEFNVYSQNALLKILEEPPKNIVFYILAPAKSALLPTIRSRLPVTIEKSRKSLYEIDLNLAKIDVGVVFDFMQKYKHVSKNEAKELVEALYMQAVRQNVQMSEKQLENFDTAYRLLELNARSSSVLLLILMGFLHAD